MKETKTLRVLGMWIQNHGERNFTVRKATQADNQTCGMLRSITNKRGGVKEQHVPRVVTAVVILRWTYSLPYHNTTGEKQKKIEAQIRKAYQIALRLPTLAPNERVIAVGPFATYKEHREALLFLQRERLKKIRN